VNQVKEQVKNPENFAQKVNRDEANRVRDQLKSDPIRVAGDLLQFASDPQATTPEVLKRILKKK
jgi:hypothetical protein